MTATVMEGTHGRAEWLGNSFFCRGWRRCSSLAREAAAKEDGALIDKASATGVGPTHLQLVPYLSLGACQAHCVCSHLSFTFHLYSRPSCLLHVPMLRERGEMAVGVCVAFMRRFIATVHLFWRHVAAKTLPLHTAKGPSHLSPVTVGKNQQMYHRAPLRPSHFSL
jgi:hypothetical protein